MTQEERKEMLALMQEAMKPMDDRLAKLEQGQADIKQELATLQQGQVKLEIVIENEVDRGIKAVAEGHGILNRKLDEKVRLESRVETLEHKVSAVEYALKQAK